MPKVRSNFGVIGREFTVSNQSSGVISGVIEAQQLKGANKWPHFVPTSPLNSSYFIGLFSISLHNSSGIALDGSGNMYMVGTSGASNIQTYKLNNSGAIQWQKSLNSGGIENGRGIAVDSSGNVYVIGEGDNAFSMQFAKFNTSGVLQWQKKLSDGGGGTYGLAIAVDSSGNVYGTGTSQTSTRIPVVKYDTSGNLQWQKYLRAAGTSALGYGIAVDSSGNVYICGYTSISGSNDIIVAKYNTSGTLQWQRLLGSNSVSDFGISIAVDSSGNAYVCGYSAASGSDDIILAKYNTSGTIQWQRSLGGAGRQQGYSVTVDSSSNVYIIGDNADTSSNPEFLIAKYNTSGTIQWQRTLGSTNFFETGKGITVDSQDNIYVAGTAGLFAKLTNDGSRTGNYTLEGITYTYAVSSYTAATSTLTDTAGSLTDNNGVFTDSTTSLTEATTSDATSTVSI